MEIFNLWLTGLSGSGKTTIAFKVSERLQKSNIPHEVLDGDVYRPVLSPGVGYTEKERNAFRHKIIFLAKLLNKHGVSCIIPLLSSSRKVREYARNELINFNEIYVKCPIDICAKRNTNGLYERAKKGKETNVVGIHIPYEEPEKPEILLETSKQDVESCVEIVMSKIKK
jgi:adenylylsulfate kinase